MPERSKSTSDDAELSNVRPYGESSVSANGSMNLPVEARRAVGIEGAERLFVFGQPGRIILTPVPLAPDLLAFASAKAAERVADDASVEPDA